MREDVHVHLHIAGPITVNLVNAPSATSPPGTSERMATELLKDTKLMRQSLVMAQAAVVALVQSQTNLTAAYATYVADEPKRQAAAVADALAADGADEDTIAQAIQTTTAAASANVQTALDAIHNNTLEPTAPPVASLPTTPSVSTDTNTGSDSNSSIAGGAGNDSIDGGSGNDSIDPNAAAQQNGSTGEGVGAVAVVSSDPSVVSQTVTDDSTHTSVILTDHPTDQTTLVTPVLSGTPDAGSISVDATSGAPVADPASGVTLGETTVASDETPTAAALAEANPSAVVSAPAVES